MARYHDWRDGPGGRRCRRCGLIRKRVPMGDGSGRCRTQWVLGNQKVVQDKAPRWGCAAPRPLPDSFVAFRCLCAEVLREAKHELSARRAEQLGFEGPGIEPLYTAWREFEENGEGPPDEAWPFLRDIVHDALVAFVWPCGAGVLTTDELKPLRNAVEATVRPGASQKSTETTPRRLGREFVVRGPDGQGGVYKGFDGHSAGADWRLGIGEHTTFYCEDADLLEAVYELHRYGAEQYEWGGLPVQVWRWKEEA